MAELKKNNLAFYTSNPDDTTVCADFTMPRYIRRIKRLKDMYPEEVDIHQNKDGSIWCRFPIRWLRIQAPANLTPEQREASSERMRTMWESRSQDTKNHE